MTSKHTPGPWKVNREGKHITTIEDAHGEDVAMTVPRDGRGEEQANARLIAAAHEMRAACRQVSDLAVHIGRGEYALPEQAMSAVDAALAKAEGRS